MLSCPKCSKPARSVQGLAAHLAGTAAHGGHHVPKDEALEAQRCEGGRLAELEHVKLLEDQTRAQL